jgi:hemolysin (HlyC) family protein
VSEQIFSKGFFARLFGGGNAAEIESGQERKSLMSAAENFHSLRVEDVMVPRADIIAVAGDTSLQELTQCFQEAGHSRLPVYGETLDEPTGFVHVKDLLGFLALDAPERSKKSYPNEKIISKILRPVIFVPQSMAADALLKKMQVGRVHMAIVVDEYGGTDGLVTLEDLIEPIVGDIEDEHDDAEPEINVLKDKKGQIYWEADARADIEDFEAVLGRDIATPEQDDEVDTLGGLVFFLAGRVPERGEIIPHPIGIEFEILEASPRRVKRLRLRQISATKALTSKTPLPKKAK